MRHISKIVLWRNIRVHAHRLMNMLVRRVAFARSMAVCMIVMCCTGCFGTHSTVEPPDVGIPNVGNSCCVNAPTQIITRLYPDAFEQEEAGIIQSGRVIFNKIHNGGASVTRQEAREFYRDVIEAGINLNLGAGIQQDARDCLEVMDEMLGRVLPPCRFYSRLVPQETTATGVWNVNQETRLFVSLPHGFDGICTVQDLLERHFIGTMLRAGRPEVDVLEQWKIAVNLGDERPLPIFFRRFELNEQGNRAKNNTCLINALAFTLPVANQYRGTQHWSYNLVGFVVHHGATLGGGHYTAYVLQNGQWRHYDDAAVRRVDWTHAASAAEQGYLFFYRKSTEAPGASDATGEHGDDAAAQPDDMGSKRRLHADAAEARVRRGYDSARESE